MADLNHIESTVIGDNVVIRNNYAPDEDTPFVALVVYVPKCQVPSTEITNLSMMMVLPHPTSN